MNKTIRIHGFPLSGHSHRVELFAGLAGIPYEAVVVDLPGGEHKRPDFLRLNPAGQVPVIEDGEVVLSDSNAILVYLAQKYAPEFYARNIVEAAEIQKFLSIAAGDLAFGPAAARLINVFGASLDRSFCVQVAERVFSRLERHLNNQRFLVGDRLTIADVSLYSYTAHAPEGGIDLSPYPDISAWLKNIEAQSGFVPMTSTAVGLAA